MPRRNYIFTKLLSIPITLLVLSFSFVGAFAQEPNFSLYPNGGTVMNKDNGFVVDVLIDTAGREIMSAKFALNFDPEVLQIKKAERNNSLFAQYPGDESSLDNENGLVMLSGFTQSGDGGLYVTGEKADVFARLTFEVLQEGETEIGWEYGENRNLFETVMYIEGSPPQDILTARNEPSVFVIGENVIDPSTVSPGLSVDKYVLATGFVLVLFGAFMVFSRPSSMVRRKGTVVIYDEE